MVMIDGYGKDDHGIFNNDRYRNDTFFDSTLTNYKNIMHIE